MFSSVLLYDNFKIFFWLPFCRYDDLDVPDTMNVHGVYDTSAYMLTFESRSEYRSYIQQEAGVSGSIFGFYAGVKEAYGSSSSGASQTFLSVLYVDIDR